MSLGPNDLHDLKRIIQNLIRSTDSNSASDDPIRDIEAQAVQLEKTLIDLTTKLNLRDDRDGREDDYIGYLLELRQEPFKYPDDFKDDETYKEIEQYDSDLQSLTNITKEKSKNNRYDRFFNQQFNKIITKLFYYSDEFIKIPDDSPIFEINYHVKGVAMHLVEIYLLFIELCDLLKRSEEYENRICQSLTNLINKFLTKLFISVNPKEAVNVEEFVHAVIALKRISISSVNLKKSASLSNASISLMISKITQMQNFNPFHNEFIEYLIKTVNIFSELVSRSEISERLYNETLSLVNVWKKVYDQDKSSIMIDILLPVIEKVKDLIDDIPRVSSKKKSKKTKKEKKLKLATLTQEIHPRPKRAEQDSRKMDISDEENVVAVIEEPEVVEPMPKEKIIAKNKNKKKRDRRNKEQSENPVSNPYIPTEPRKLVFQQNIIKADEQDEHFETPMLPHVNDVTFVDSSDDSVMIESQEPIVNLPVDPAWITAIWKELRKYNYYGINELLNILDAQNVKYYIVGGFPRDWLSGKPISDIDIIIEGPFDAIQKLIPSIHKVPQFDNLYKLGKKIDITILPKGFSLDNDRRTRDANLNAFYLTPTDLYGTENAWRELWDQSAPLTMVKEPASILINNPKACLRMISLSYKLNRHLHTDVIDAIKQYSNRILELNYHEFRILTYKLFSNTGPANVFRDLVKLNILENMLPTAYKNPSVCQYIDVSVELLSRLNVEMTYERSIAFFLLPAALNFGNPKMVVSDFVERYRGMLPKDPHLNTEGSIELNRVEAILCAELSALVENFSPIDVKNKSMHPQYTQSQESLKISSQQFKGKSARIAMI